MKPVGLRRRGGISVQPGANPSAIVAVKVFIDACNLGSLCAAVCLVAAPIALGQGDDRLVGIWFADEGYRTVELLFRMDGGYELDMRHTDAVSEFGSTDRGRYQVAGQSLTITSYQYLDSPLPDVYQFEVVGDSLSLSGSNSDLPREYRLKSGSRADVLARERSNLDLFRTWGRHVRFVGDEEYTFRPDGYYFLKSTLENVDSPPDFVRGRYALTGHRLTLKPYSGGEAVCEIDVFGTTLTVIETNAWSGWFTSFEEVPGSATEVAAKTAESEAFLSDLNWQAGLWQFQNGDNAIDLLLRPDGIYSATNSTPLIRRVLRGRYTLADKQIHLVPFVGQERFTFDDASFGMVEQTYTLDYYDSELQIIDLKPFQQLVLLARKSPGTQASVLEKARMAQAEREREGWHIGIWEANDSAAWVEFTFRPDNRYIGKAGAERVASEVERGQYVVAPGKISLAPYPGNGPARGFELDLYDGDLFLIGDPRRLVVVRKIPNSETGVIEKTRNPVALKGERGSILGLWTANRPTESVELVFRQDGQFRLKRCTNNVTSYDYGVYTVDMATRTLVYDSRFIAIQTQQLDFYGDTMTIYGGLTNGFPSTYTINLGSVDAVIAESLAADAEGAQADTQWRARVPIGLKDPDATQKPLPGIPSDHNQGQIFDEPTVFLDYESYRRLIPRFLFYPDGKGSLLELAVLDSQEWHFFPTGRVLVRFRHYRAGWPYPMTIEEVTDVWGAYEIGLKPTQTDILHIYADNALTLRTDLGEQLTMTLEGGRRNLFWGKECNVLDSWALEQKPIACQRSGNSDASLINTGLSLSSDIKSDIPGASGGMSIMISAGLSGTFTIRGTSELARSLVLERALSLAPPIMWEPLRSNNVPAGPFSFTITQSANAAAFFRIRGQ